MKLDLLIAALALGAGLWGAFTGAARQLAGWGALAVALVAARPLGRALAPLAANALHAPGGLSLVAASFGSFVVVLVTVRWMLTRLLRGVLSAGDPERHAPDRVLGFALGAAKVFAIAFVALSALAFVEDHVRVTGAPLGLVPGDSVLFGAARRYNLFEMREFAPARELLRLQPSLLAQPAKGRSNPQLAALRADPRVREALAQPAVRRALEQGDAFALLRNDAVVKLLRDPEVLAKLHAAQEP